MKIRKNTNKFIATTLTLVMLLGILPLTAFELTVTVSAADDPLTIEEKMKAIEKMAEDLEIDLTPKYGAGANVNKFIAPAAQ